MAFTIMTNWILFLLHTLIIHINRQTFDTFLVFRFSDYISGGILAEGLSVARYEKSVPQSLNVELSFQSTAYQTDNEKQGLNDINVLVDRVSIFDTEGNR